MRSMSNVQFMTTAEVAAALKVSPRRVSRMVESGTLTPATKLPGVRGAFLFDPETVRAASVEK